MTTKHRRTKGKDWDENSSDDLSDDDSDATNKLKRISYVKREKLKEQKKTQKVLSMLCDSEDNSSDAEQKKLRSSRPLPSLPINVTKKKSKYQVSSNSDDSSSDSDFINENKKSKASKVNVSSKKSKEKMVEISSESNSEHKKRTSSKRHKVESAQIKSISNKNKKITNSKSEKNQDRSESDSSKEFQKPKLKNKALSKSKFSIGEHVLDDYSIIATPTKSDDENIPVETKEEISLKHRIVEEVDKIQKIFDDLKSDLECQSDYLLKKKINVVRDSKFIAHKILRIYDCTHEKLKENRSSFANVYKSWLDTCSNKKLSPNKSPKKRYKLYSDDEGSEDMQKKNVSSTEKTDKSDKRKSLNAKSSKKNTKSDGSDEECEEMQEMDVSSTEIIDQSDKRKSLRMKSSKESAKSDSSNEDEENKDEEDEDKRKKDSSSKRKISLDNKKKTSTTKSLTENGKSSSDESDESEDNKKKSSTSLSTKSKKDKSDDSDEIENNGDLQKKESSSEETVTQESKKKKLSLSIKSTKENAKKAQKKDRGSSDSDENSKEKDDSTSKKTDDLNVSDDEPKNQTNDNNGDVEHEDDSPAQVSACDSDAIFSSDETRSKKHKKKTAILEEKAVENDENEERAAAIDKEHDPLERSNSTSSEDLFETTVSEVGNTPVKSPILSTGQKSLRRTLFIASKAKNASTPMDVDEEPAENSTLESTEAPADTSNLEPEKSTDPRTSEPEEPPEAHNSEPEEPEEPTESRVLEPKSPEEPPSSESLSQASTDKQASSDIHEAATLVVGDGSGGDGSEEEDSESEARRKLLADCSPDEKSSSSSNDDDDDDDKKRNNNNDVSDADSEKSVNSTCSTVVGASTSSATPKTRRSARKSEEAEDKKKLLHKNKRLPMQTKKQTVISSGSSSSSSSAAEGQDMRRRKRRRTAARSQDDNSGTEGDEGLTTRMRRRKPTFNVRRNRHYKADEKLRLECRVDLERLSSSVLRKYARALDKSKGYVANRKLKSVTNLDGLETKKRPRRAANNAEEITAASGPTSDSESAARSNSGPGPRSKKKAASKAEKKKSVIDHLDGASGTGSGEDEPSPQVKVNASKEMNDSRRVARVDVHVEEEAAKEAESRAKEALMKSDSSSSDDNAIDKDVESEKDSKKSKKAKENKARKEESPVELSDEKSENEKSENENENENGKSGDEESEDEKDKSDKNKEKKKERGAWKKDEVLNFHITDTESEEEKFTISQEKKKAKKAKEAEDDSDKSGDEDDPIEVTPVKTPVKKKRAQRKKRRILDSDSDAKINSSDEDSDAQMVSEEEMEEKKKKGRKRRPKSSEEDSSSSDKKPKSKRRRIKKVATDSDSGDEDSPNKGRKNIRKVLKDKHIADETKKAAQDEEERLKRIAERQRLFNEMYDARLAGEAKVDKLVLDFDEETKKELVVVNEELVKRLKPHQAKGIKFMWDACFESLKQIEKSEGSGCIIAHCMGLGKTFQVVTLAHTLLCHEETGVKTVMVVCPLSTVLNWVNEFKTWLKHVKDADEIEIYELTKMKKNIERKYQLESWQKTGGVLIIGYEMFRNLTSTGKKMRKAMQESIMRSLVDPGADLVVCDEGHLLKNEDSALSKAMKLVKTFRRVVLTGTPLQNNLKEYHCMVQFVKPNLLGTKKEFLNRFVNPITNGQFDDSTPYDVKLMKKRAHVLHKMLEGSVQRFDYSVLTPFLPPKSEYVIFVRLTPVQIKLYQHYLDNFARRFGQRNGSLFADFQALQRIWTHPYVLRLNAEKNEKIAEKKRLEASDSEGSLKDFIDDDSDTEASSISMNSSGSNSDVECLDSDKEKPTVKPTRSTRLNPKDEPVEEVPIQESVEEAPWWTKFVEEEHFEDLRISTKITLLFGILKESEQIGDKVLVFSQSLYSLTLIEHFLNLIDQETQNGGESENLENHSGNWCLGLDYFRLDGSTSAENRSAWCKIFNNPKNTRARLFLISTRAGGLGINLTAANRVIIFDASWNPSHDVQSIFRIYRFGQKKPCYVYRFLAAGTMEEKIYNRQVTKLSLACRVVDEQQIERHYSNNDLAELYQFDSYEGKSIPLNLPKDRLLAEIFLKYKDAVYNYHEHDSLLENKEEEELDEEERKQAWLEYEEEKQGKRQMINMGNNVGFNPMMMNSFPELESIKLLIQKDYPNLPPEHLETVARQAVYDMYRFVDQQAVSQILNPFAAGQTGMPQQNMLGAAPTMQQMTQQQQTFNQQSQLMNMLNQPQMNYPGVNQMPVYSGRGRPPKHMSMSNPMPNMARQMQMPMQMPQNQIPAMGNNDVVEILNDQQVTQPNIDPASNINNIQKE